MVAVIDAKPDGIQALRTSLAALRRIADYRLPKALDRRLLGLGENKENLSAAERAELLALVEFTNKRTIEKLEAELAVRQLAAAFPILNGNP